MSAFRFTLSVVLLLLLVRVLAVLSPLDGWAESFTEDFSQNPYSVSAEHRWCERFHEGNWNSGNAYMEEYNGPLVSAFPCFTGHSCSGTPVGCSSCTISDGIGICSATGLSNFGATAVITERDYAGAVRSFEMAFGVGTDFDPSRKDHAAPFSVIHPNCHTAIEAVLGKEAGGGYSLTIVVPDSPHPDDPLGLDFPECGEPPIFCLGSTPVPWFSPEGTVGRYRIKMESEITANGLELLATMTDTLTGQTVCFPAGCSPCTSVAIPGWYTDEAQRFGFGGQRSDRFNPFLWDDGVASAGC